MVSSIKAGRKLNLAGRLKEVRPTAVKLSTQELVTAEPYYPDKDMPWVIRPRSEQLELIPWTLQNLDFIQAKLLKHGALLFRGFDLETDADFSEYMDAMPYELLEYFEGSTPRKEVSKKVYTSTLFPSTEAIALHSEYSSSTKFPMKVWFFCAKEPKHRGETPVASAGRILQRMDPEIRDRFRRKGWMLIRNFGDGLGLPWRRAFAISDRDELDAYCAKNQIEARWKDDDRLTTRQVRSAILTHPVTDEEVWFNHMAFWHAANLKPSVRKEMVEELGYEGLPFHTYYGDGTPIPDEVAHHIRDAYLAEKIKFPWQHGDLMLIDNMLSCHGREPFDCERAIRVAMGEPYYRPDFTPLP